MRRIGFTLIVVVLCIVGTCASAYAAFGPARLVSASSVEQADRDSIAAVTSANGRYVLFQTSARNLFPSGYQDPPGGFRRGGIFRKDLETGAIETVALGDAVDNGSGLLYTGASNPSASADGRYVAFHTNQQLAPTDVNDTSDVYVRDMDAPLGSAGAFKLVSALDGSESPPAYAGSGATVASSGAISADGSKVVFAVGSSSNLPAGAAQVPGNQVFVRNLDQHATALINATRDAGSGSMTSTPAGSGAGNVPVARISGDGSTVVWAGQDAVAQTRYVPGNPDTGENRRDLMWRRTDDPGAPTRRVSGYDDPDDPGCPPGATLADAACAGPFKQAGSVNAGIGDGAFALSGDGKLVAFTTDVTPRSSPISSGDGKLNAFVADMASGVTRKQGLRELTRESFGSTAPDVSADIGSKEASAISISGDGRWVAFATVRTHFLLPLPTVVGSVPSQASQAQLWAVDLASNTIQLVTRAADGNVSRTGNASAPSLDATGSRLAFLSSADDLVIGDSNSSIDAFVVDFTDSGAPLPQQLPADYAPYSASGAIAIRAGFQRGRRGAIRVAVSVPQAGRVIATATARIGKRRSKVGAGSAQTQDAGLVELVIKPRGRAARRARKHGLAARVAVSFQAAGGGSARTSIPVTFGGKL